MSKPCVGISSCLLGENVRYDGGNKLNVFIRDELGESLTLIPVCAEVESGMETPRGSMDLHEDNGIIRMITGETGVDMTSMVKEWTEKKLVELAPLNLCGFIFKAKSPSCALHSAIVYRESHVSNDGRGLFAHGFTQRFPLVPVVEETELVNELGRKTFLDKVFAAQLMYASFRI